MTSDGVLEVIKIIELSDRALKVASPRKAAEIDENDTPSWRKKKEDETPENKTSNKTTLSKSKKTSAGTS